MSGQGSVTLKWGDGEYLFRLPLGQLRELQTIRQMGAIEIMDRLRERRWHTDDIRETVRLGLIGGGMAPTEALVKVIQYIDNRPIMESHATAFIVLMAALAGVPDDQPGKETAEEPRTDGSASPPSTDQEPRLDGPPEKSMN